MLIKIYVPVNFPLVIGNPDSDGVSTVGKAVIHCGFKSSSFLLFLNWELITVCCELAVIFVTSFRGVPTGLEGADL